jgi:hypothetical protein
MGFLCKFVSVIGIFQRSFRMSVCRRKVAFFVMFGGSAMGLRRKFVLLSRFSMGRVHSLSSFEEAWLTPFHKCTRRANYAQPSIAFGRPDGRPPRELCTYRSRSCNFKAEYLDRWPEIRCRLAAPAAFFPG